MGTVTTMAIIVLGMKMGITALSGAGICLGLNWFNKKSFVAKEKKVQESDQPDSTVKFDSATIKK